MTRRFVWGIAAALAAVAAGSLLYYRSVPSHGRFPQEVYVWQRLWGPEVGMGVERAKDAFPTFYVYAGDIVCESDSVASAPTAVDWAMLRGVGNVVPVFRAAVGLASRIRDVGAERVAGEFAAAFNAAAEAGAAAGVSLLGLQVDFDCPTESLDGYGQLLGALRVAVPDKELSITVLPTWLTSRAFRGLARQADFLVLQVHGLEHPRTLDDRTVLCDAGRARRYVREIARCGRDFYVALPTYAYEALYLPTGEFAGFVAEGAEVPRTGVKRRFLSADPIELAALVTEWQERRPRHMRGVIWFRLPVDTDRRNWGWPVLQSVMEGRVPETHFQAELRRVREGLYELWLSSLGPYTPMADIQLVVRGRGARIEAADAVNGFSVHVADGSLTLTGPAPREGEPILAAWWRAEAEPKGLAMTFEAGNVEVVK